MQTVYVYCYIYIGTVLITNGSFHFWYLKSDPGLEWHSRLRNADVTSDGCIKKSDTACFFNAWFIFWFQHNVQV